MKTLNKRTYVLKILTTVLVKGHSLDSAFDRYLPQEDQTEPWIKAACFGILRHMSQLDYLIENLSLKPKKNEAIQLILYIGLYELLFMQAKFHAAVFETVELTKIAHLQHQSGFVNALLNRAIREGERVLQSIPSEKTYNHPSWLIEKLKKAYPHHWQGIITANNQPPPLFLRVNRQKISRESYAQILVANSYKLPDLSPVAIELLEGVKVSALPHFKEGFVSVQDLAAQQAAFLLDLQKDQIVLDACAAPGGKATHILEEASVQLYAVDQDSTRLHKVEENLKRLDLKANLIAKDTLLLDFRPASFDRILLDAPCSGTGVIRRHPDIRFLRRESDIQQLTALQSKLLYKLWPMLKPGGILLYVTCSVLPQENDEIIKAFLTTGSNAKIVPLRFNHGKSTETGWQFLPEPHGTDGFYYAKLLKT